MARTIPGVNDSNPQTQSAPAVASAPEAAASVPAVQEAPQGFLERYAGADQLPEQVQVKAGGGGYLAFLSSRGDNGIERAKIMEVMAVGEGHPVLNIDGQHYDAARMAMVVLDHFVFWGIQENDDGWGVGSVKLEAQEGKEAFAAGYSAFARLLTIWLPGSDPLPADLQPAIPLAVPLRKQHVKLLAVHTDAILRAAQPRFLEGQAMLAKLPPKLRIASRISSRVRPSRGRPTGDGKKKSSATMVDSAAAPAALTLAQATALSAANTSASFLARLEIETARHNAAVAAIKDCAAKGSFYRG